MKKKSKISKQKITKKKKITKSKIGKQKIGKRKIKKQNIAKIRFHKNPNQLSLDQLFEITNRPGVDTVSVHEFLTSPIIREQHREIVDGWLFDKAQEEHLNLATVRAIRDGLDIMFGTKKQIYDFDKRPSNIPIGISSGISRLPRNWY